MYFDLHKFTTIPRGRILGRYQLLEAFHILDSNQASGFYKTKLAYIMRNAIDAFLNINNQSFQLIKVFKNSDILYYLEDFQITYPTIFNIKVFISYNKNSDIEGFSILNHDFDKLVYKSQLLYSEKEPLTYSIFLNMQDLYDPDNLPVLYHEFMHVFQAIKSDSLKDNMSNGYMMAENILNKRMALMNLVSLKNSLNNQKLSNEQLKGFLAACIYYTEYLERAAYLQNVYNEINAQKELYNSDNINAVEILNDSPAYNIYKCINRFTENYLNNKYKLNDNQINYINDVFQEYCKIFNLKSEIQDLNIKRDWLKNISIRKIFKIWNKGSEFFIKKADKIISHYF